MHPPDARAVEQVAQRLICHGGAGQRDHVDLQAAAAAGSSSAAC
jgi:hypothetical protein